MRQDLGSTSLAEALSLDPHALLINLNRSTDRLDFQRRQLARVGIALERVEAVDAGAISDQEFNSRYSGWQRPLSRNEVGCFLSHRLAWQRVVAERRPLLVLEDDALLSDNIAAVLANLTPPREPVSYNLETSSARKLVAKQPAASLSHGHSLRRIYDDRGGSAAYVLTPEAAEAYLKDADRLTASPDAFMNHRRAVKRYQIDPALAVQMIVLSDLLQERMSAAARSTIAPTRTQSRSRSGVIRHPRMKARRLWGNILKTALQAWTIGRAAKRCISYCPTILTSVAPSQPSAERAA